MSYIKFKNFCDRIVKLKQVGRNEKPVPVKLGRARLVVIIDGKEHPVKTVNYAGDWSENKRNGYKFEFIV